MKLRLDELLVRKKLVTTKSQAKQLIEKGKVSCAGRVVSKAGYPVDEEAEVSVAAGEQYVSRGAYKLEAAIKQFKIDPKDKVIADIGASTGGFTDYLLKNGAKKVYTIDVGTDQLHPSLKTNPRVINMEGVNIRELEELPENIDFAVVDLSYISLRLTLPNISKITNGPIIALLKPQFEAGPGVVGKDGVIKDQEKVETIVTEFKDWCATENLPVSKLIPSPITGKKGNHEYLILINRK